MENSRRYDIDWLRVIAIALLLIYHISIVFQPWGFFVGFMTNDASLEWIWAPMSMLNVWRIPFLFFVSGMGVYFAIQRRDWKGLFIERSKRILAPLIFGVVAIVPIHLWLQNDYYNQPFEFSFNPAHLWFLANIYIYVLLFAPIFFYLKNHPESGLQKWLDKILSHPAGLLLLMIPFIAEVEILQPESFEHYAMNAHGFWIGLIAFFTGFICVYSGQAFWNMVLKWRWLTLGIASALYALRFAEGDFSAPYYLKAVESNLWIFSVFGFGYKHLNKPGKVLAYLSPSAYPVYILHMVFLYLATWLFLPTDLAPSLKLIIVIAITFVGCFISYELIRRVKYLRPLFGLKLK